MHAPRPIIACVTIVACFALTSVRSPAAPVAGKWGLGVDTGDLLDSAAEGTLILGRSERTAWLLFLGVSGRSGDVDSETKYVVPDTLLTAREEFQGYSVTLGPGIRRYVRQSGRISAYLDGYTRFGRIHDTSDRSAGTFQEDGERSTWSAGGGFALGVEYFFERWPVSLAAHTNFLSFTYRWDKEERAREDGLAARRTFESFDLSAGVGPRVQVRVYF